MFSEKYLAGLIDADGHLSIRARVGAKPDLELCVVQRAEYKDPLEILQKMFGGVLRYEAEGRYARLYLRAGPARKAFERLKKYMVLKRDQAERFLDLVDASCVLKDTRDVMAVRERVKAIRSYGATHEPNFPSRKWMAGYVDGDGSFVVGVNPLSGYAYPTLSIFAAPNYIVGVTLLQKAFGGKLQAIGRNARWTLHLSQPSKIEKVLGFFAQHLFVKRAQALFLLGCARGGNLRDGETIRNIMRTLNAQQHRLSDPDTEVARLLKEVRFDIPRGPVGRPRCKRQSNLQNVGLPVS